ncbi:MAG TPA: hydrogenase maturation protease [Mycobacterium sp.]|nr:hydrogenase maturation protease [Mycobacterium sp.]
MTTDVDEPLARREETVAVIGFGNSFRRDDGVGPAVAAAIEARAIPGVSVLTAASDPAVVLEAWAGVRLAVLIDAVVTTPCQPGRIHRCAMSELVGSPAVSSHGMDIATLLALGEVLHRIPDDVVVFAVEVKETGYGVGLTPNVHAAVPLVVDAVMATIGPETEGRQRSWAPTGS